MLYRIFLAFALALLIGPVMPAAATTAPPASAAIDGAGLDAYIAAQMQKHGLPGVALAITQGGQIVFSKGYGSAGAGPMTPQTPMFIGSQSKSFTALAIAQLIDAGKVELNAPVRTYIPWFAVADPEASARISVYHLLHHTSGLSEAGFSHRLPDNAPIEAVVRALATAELTAPVGARFQYFNTGYEVLAAIVETVSGQTYADYMQQHIFDPLGMARTTTDPAIARANGLAQGYTRFFGFALPAAQASPRYAIGAGYIISTAEDMARYAIDMNSAAASGASRLLTPQSARRLFAPVQGYAMGWFVEPGHIYHGGANETFKTFVDLYPSRDIGIVLLINQGYLLDHYISAPQLFSGIEAIVLGQEPPPPAQGWSVQWLGWGLGLFVLALSVFQARNLLQLRRWRARAHAWSAPRRAWDIALSFIIPTVIFAVVLWQLKDFFSYRFNLVYQLTAVFRVLPDIGVLMIVGLLPDYLQGGIKLYLGLRRQQAAPAREASR